MKALVVKSSFDAPDLSDDTEVGWPTNERTAGLNLVGRGHDLHLRGGEMNGHRVFAGGFFSRIEISGLRGDFSAAPQDALPLNCKAAICHIRNCRFTGINGQQSGIHGDGIQLQDNSAFDFVSITNTTIYSAYQAIMHNRGSKVIFLDRLNIRDEPRLRKQLSIALYLVNSKIILGEDVWIDWPSASHATFFKGSKVTGSVRHGVPPGGDFCPA